MASAAEWEKEVYTTIQIRRYDKSRLSEHAFPREPSWRTVGRLLDIMELMETYGGWLTIKRKLDNEEI
jgi:hypothetical protein